MARLRPRFVPHFPAIIFALTALLLPIGAINGQNNLLFWVFGVAVATLLGSGIIGAWTISNITIEREPIEPIHAGDLLRIRYRITNSSRWLPAFAIAISELNHRPLILGKARTTPTWPQRLTQPFAFAELIPRKSTITITAEAAATARGLATFDAVQVWTTFPFGLSRKTMLHAREQSAIIRPLPARIHPDFIASLARGRDLRAAGTTPLAGGGDEFHSLREHIQGEPTRSIAWKRSATAEKLLVRQNAQPPNRRLWIGLADLRRATPDELNDTLSTAAGLAIAAANAGYAVGFLAHTEVGHLPPRQSARAIAEILDALALLDPAQHSESLPPPPRSIPARIAILGPRPSTTAIPSAGLYSPDQITTGHLPSHATDPSRSPKRSWKRTLAEFLSPSSASTTPTTPTGGKA